MYRVSILFLFIGMLLAACAGSLDQSGQVQNPLSEMADQGQSADLPDLGPAPELSSEIWINSDQPLRLAQLRGKVVLLEMWTFGCYNCQNTLPAVKDWHARYADRGLVIIGNHYPEFSYERDLSNLKEAVQRSGILFPVAQDNEGITWRAYGNRYWPTMYLIDKRGHLRYTHIGEGAYATTEQAIQTLLAEKAE